MHKAASAKHAKNYAEVSLTDDRIILCTMHGQIDEEIVRKSLEETTAHIQQLRARKDPVFLLIDATQVTGQTSGARRQAKKLGSMGIDRLAICSRSVALGMVIQYLVRASGMSNKARIFRRRAEALQWLLHRHEVAPRQRRGLQPILTLSAFAAVMAITLIAWRQSDTNRHHTQATAVREELTSKQTLISERVNAYVNALRGYRSFLRQVIL